MPAQSVSRSKRTTPVGPKVDRLTVNIRKAPTKDWDARHAEKLGAEGSKRRKASNELDREVALEAGDSSVYESDGVGDSWVGDDGPTD